MIYLNIIVGYGVAVIFFLLLNNLNTGALIRLMLMPYMAGLRMGGNIKK